jgi:hypothetical protein
MIKKRTSFEVVPAIILVFVLIILGVCLFMVLQHVPMKQITYSVNETKQVKQAVPAQQVKQAVQAKQAQQVKQAIQSTAPILLPIHVPEKRIVKFTPVRNRITPAPIKLTRMVVRKRPRKMHYVEVIPDRRS